MKVEITLPTTIAEIPLQAYQKFVNASQNSEDEQFLMEQMVQSFCGIELRSIAKMKMNDLTEIIISLTETLKSEGKFHQRFKIKDLEFGFIPNLEDISFGEYVDLENYLQDVSNFHKAMAVMYRPIKETKGERYTIHEYKGSDEYSDLMKFAPLEIVKGANVFFWTLEKRIIESYTQIFGEGDDSGNENALSERTQFAKQWGWYGSLYVLASNDITKFDAVTKLGLRKCLTFLTFKKQSDEIQEREFNRITKRQ
jgi:hypothetical protein